MNSLGGECRHTPQGTSGFALSFGPHAQDGVAQEASRWGPASSRHRPERHWHCLFRRSDYSHAAARPVGPFERRAGRGWRHRPLRLAGRGGHGSRCWTGSAAPFSRPATTSIRAGSYAGLPRLLRPDLGPPPRSDIPHAGKPRLRIRRRDPLLRVFRSGCRIARPGLLHLFDVGSLARYRAQQRDPGPRRVGTVSNGCAASSRRQRRPARLPSGIGRSSRRVPTGTTRTCGTSTACCTTSTPTS